MRLYHRVSLQFLQDTQPWRVPYSETLNQAVQEDAGLGHLMGSHAVLHAAKTVGQLAAVFENLDHTGKPPSPAQLEVLRDKSADLVTAAMRLANLYGFELARAVVERSEEKNGVTLPEW
jgi:hypothetical protein